MRKICTLLLALVPFLLVSTQADAGPFKIFKKGGDGERRVGRGDTFLGSDDYKEGEEVVGVFLTDDEYGQMVEDLEYRDIDFDWAWAKADYKGKEKIRSLDFSVKNYSTVTIPPVKNFSSSLEEGLEDHVRDGFVRAMERLGLQVVDAGGDLTLGVVIVDYKSDSTYIYFGNLDPFIELELRLQQGDETLLLIRDQEHSSTPRAAATDFASQLLRFLQ